ncbi:MAG: glycosyltransferase [Candidatus Neomarinimicrobiota bacterium]
MRITLIGPFTPFRGGISDFNTALFKELDNSHTVQIINFSTQYPNFLFPGKTQYKNNDINPVESEQILSSINPLAWSRTSNKIVEFQPELVVFHYWMPFFAPAFRKIAESVNKKTQAKIIVICHNLIPHEKFRFTRFLTKTFLNKVDRFIVMSESVRSELLNIISDAKHKLVPHPIYNIFGNTIEKRIARKNLDIKAKNVILYFGLIREYKGLDILLKSVPKIKQELDDFIVIVAGECYENAEKYIDLVEKLKIHDSVDLKLKFIPDSEVSEYFSAADVIALPYRTATQSGIIQIAYNFDRPVVVSDVGGLAEIVLDGKTGYVVKPISDEFAKALVKYFRDDNFDQFSKNILVHKKLFSWNNFIDNLIELGTE